MFIFFVSWISSSASQAGLRAITTICSTVLSLSTPWLLFTYNAHGTVFITLSCDADEEEGEELKVSEAVEQALNTRSKGILKQISCLAPEAYSDVKELRVWASTFNVNGEKPQPDHDFRSWLIHPGDLSCRVSTYSCADSRAS